MRLLKILFILLPLFMFSCGHNHDHTHPHEHDNDHNHNFKNATLRIFTAHPDFVLTEAEFETVTEQVLTKDAYHVGASFETVTEQVLKSEGYNTYKILDSKDIALVTNDEINKITVVPCISFTPAAEVVSIEIPAEYTTRSLQKVVVDGTGALVPAAYETRTYVKLIKPARLNNLTEDRDYEDYQFRILEDIDLEDYLISQLSLQGLDDCLLSTDYEVL